MQIHTKQIRTKQRPTVLVGCVAVISFGTYTYLYDITSSKYCIAALYLHMYRYRKKPSHIFYN